MVADERGSNHSLATFGALSQPTARRVAPVRLGDRQVGWWARLSDSGSLVYVTERDSEDHRYRGEDPYYRYDHDDPGYGLSLALYERLYRRDVGAVYVLETDTGVVYHFGFMQFVNGTPINTKREARGRGYEKDVQSVVPITEAVEVWHRAADDFWDPQPVFL